MRLRDLLDVPELALRLVVGGDDALDSPVRWTYSSDLMDPRRYLLGGELVITGLVWRRTPTDSEEFVANLARAGALAIAAGTAQFGEVPDDVVDACRRHGIALLAVPEQVSFSSLTEYVIGAAAAERGARLEARLGRNRDLLSALARGESLDGLLARVGTELHAELRLFTAGGSPVAGADLVGPAIVDELVAGYLGADRLPVEIGSSYVVHPVLRPRGSRLTSWMLVAEVGADADRELVDDALDELATIVQVERTRTDERRTAVRPLADDAIRLISAGMANRAETGVRLEQAGLDPRAAAYFVVVLGLDAPGDSAESRLLAEEVLGTIDGSMVALTPDEETMIVVPAGGPGGGERAVKSALARLAPGLTDRRLVVGISEETAIAGLAGMLEEALHAYRLAAIGDERVSIVAGREVDSHVLLLATVPDDVRRLFAQRVLGPVLAYDEAHDGGLLTTLTAFLDCSGSWNRTAQRLHLHVNTVRYRIARVEKLTGRDLSRLSDRVDVFLALRSWSGR